MGQEHHREAHAVSGRASVAALAVPCLLGLGSPSAAAQDLPGARAVGIHVAIGVMGSGNYGKDMRAFQSAAGRTVSGGSIWFNLGLGFVGHVYQGLYVVPELVWSVSRIKSTIAGFEAAPNEKTVSLLQYGGGLRYYVYEHRDAAFFLQPSLRWVSGMSDVDGFPMKPKGVATELKGGAELVVAALRVGFEVGYAAVPVKPPVDPAYAAQFNAPATALGGNYGGAFGTLTCSFWW
jgi:hypothetical protein